VAKTASASSFVFVGDRNQLGVDRVDFDRVGIDVADHVLGQVLDTLRGHHGPLGRTLQLIIAVFAFGVVRRARRAEAEEPRAKHQSDDERRAREKQIQREQRAHRRNFSEHQQNLSVGDFEAARSPPCRRQLSGQ